MQLPADYISHHSGRHFYSPTMTYVDLPERRISRFLGCLDASSPSSLVRPGLTAGSLLPLRFPVCPICYTQFDPSSSFTGFCPSCSATHSIAPSVPDLDSTSDSFMMNHMLHVVNDVLREDHINSNGFARDHMQHGPVRLCSRCGAGSNSLSFCFQCQDYFQQGHQLIGGLSTRPTYNGFGTPSPPVASPGLQQQDSDEDDADADECDKHPPEKLVLFCKTCGLLACSRCIISYHQRHVHTTVMEEFRELKPNIESLVHSSMQEMGALNRSAEAAEKMRENVIEKRKEAIAKVHQIFQAHKEAVIQREKEMVAQIMAIGDLRLDGLAKERESIETELEKIQQLTSSMEEANSRGKKASVVLTHYKLSDKINREGSQETTTRSPVEDASFIIQSNSSRAASALKTLCTLTTTPFPPLCTAVGEGLFHPRINRNCTVVVYTKDRSGEPCLEGGKHLTVQIKAKSDCSHTVPADIRDNQDGSCSINFRPRLKGEHQMVIAVRDHHIQGSPFTLSVDGGREYTRFGMATSVFGSEGSGTSQFCRPWGICCDQQGNVIVGDRSNHRIQVFDSNGMFKHMFGTEGIRPGQFNRPAGVAVTREGHIVVADKDNHRIQIFTLDGTFLSMFGSKGGNDGQMIYPYDVAVNQLDGRMAITDTGNHRLLIFSHDGILLGKFGYKGYLCGHFDSPRGICFTDEGHIIISDFNVHHILVIHPEGTTARILGSHGSGNGQFLRPQGIAVDHLGNFVIADTRNNRIVIMHPSGHFIAKFGSGGSSPGQFDRPTSVCVLPDGRIAVVDFGNSRIQIF